MKSLISISLISIIVASCNKFKNEEENVPFKKEGIENIESTKIENEIRYNDSVELYNKSIERKRHQRNNSTRWNTDEPTWVDKNGNRYTADEIRRLRENDQEHIYRTHGDPVH